MQNAAYRRWFALSWIAVIMLLFAPAMSLAQGKAKGKRKNAEKPAAKAAEDDQRDDQTDDDADDADIPRVVPAFDPGSHTRPIRALGFTADKSRLVTVGEDHSIQVWSTATGERLDILHLPAFGHEQGYNSKLWNIAAVSSNARFVAIGGGQKQALSPENATDRAKLLVVDVAGRKVYRINSPRGAVTALAFTPDGSALAATYSGEPRNIVIYHDPTELRRRKRRVVTATNSQADSNVRVDMLEFSPDGKRLLAATKQKQLTIWDVDRDEPEIIKHFEVEGHTTALGWSADSRKFVRCWSAFEQHPHGYEIRSVNGALVQETKFDDNSPFGNQSDPWGVQFLDDETLLLSLFNRGGRAGAKGREAPGPLAIRIKWKSGQSERLLSAPDLAPFPTLGAVSADGKFGAIVVAMGLDAVVYRVKDGAVVSRCGAESPIPSHVGWAAEGRPAGFAWSEEARVGRNNTTPEDLDFGFDLTTMEPLADVRPDEYVVRQGEWNDWSVRNPERPNEFLIQRRDEVVGTLRGGSAISAISLVPRPDKSPLVAWGARGLLMRTNSAIMISTSEGKQVASLRPFAVHPRDLAPSPDGKYLIVSNGTHRLCLYPTDGRSFPLLSFARVKGEWVAWSGEGYFTASPGGEKMIGWAVSNGHGELATFHTAEKFARHFRRPDLLKRAVALGSMEAALKQVETRAPVIEDILPPKCELKLVKQTGARIEIHAAATSGNKDKPVVALRLLLDGRPTTGGVGTKTIKPGESAEATWELDIPAGNHELKLLARNDDSSAVSDPLAVTGPKSAGQQPVLHRLCVGVNEYRLPALNLTSAVKDARDMFAAFEQHCVGPENRFGSAAGEVIVDQDATRNAVLKSLAAIREAAKPGDLVVFQFAGHGIRQEDEYFLMTHEADPSQSLVEHALSGADLREALAEMKCPVLLILDACHSARSVKAFRPATDEVTRDLAADAVGVTVMAAAMAHEVATATEENGHFTAAFLKALELGKGVPFDPHDHALYAHHIYSVVFTEVRAATKGKQNPFLNMPWTVPPFALRDVPKEP